MEFITAILESIDFDTNVFIQAALIITLGALFFGLIGRYAFGKHSGLTHAISSAIDILFVYAATIVLYSAGAQFKEFIAPLPFVSIEEENLAVFSFQTAEHTAICTQLLSMVILAFFANLIDSVVPRGKNLFTWLFFRCASVILAMALNLLADHIFTTYLPEGIVTYAPTILLWLLITLLLVGALKYVVGMLLISVSPVIAAFYTFFFASVVGRHLTKAVLTTLLLSALVWALNAIGCTVISIASAALIAYVPLLVILLVIWYIVNKDI